jgi:hypothetical protein
MKTDDNTEIKGTTAFKYFESMFTNSGKCKEEVLNRNEHVRKATKNLNGLL